MSEPQSPSTGAAPEPALADPSPAAVPPAVADAPPAAPAADVAAVTAVPTATAAVPAPPPAMSRSRFALLYVLPVMLALAWIALPLARGTTTLYMRDVLNAHLEMKWAEARALRQGFFPLLDPYRGGGEPLAGNPNGAPFYPTTVLLLWASPIWALNAHFWIHLLLAPFAGAWMARRWGLAREPAWAAGVCYAACGFYLSHLSFYNLIAGATLAPALVAACLGCVLPGRGRRAGLYAAAAGLLWALLLVGGDPLMVALGGGLAATALAVTGDRWLWRRGAAGGGGGPAWRLLLLVGAAFVCGTLIALPQIEEFLRILPQSFRGVRGYTASVATIASWDPRQAAEWLLPTLFGRLDIRLGGTFWAAPYFTGAPPLYPSLYPGLLALALIAAGGRPRGRAAWWAWGAIAAGIFFSLGRFNPLMQWLFARGGSGALRYPVKFWLPVAVGASLLCGQGFAKVMAAVSGAAAGAGAGAESGAAAPDAARRRFVWALGGLTLLLGVAWVLLNAAQGLSTRFLRAIIPAAQPQWFVANERVRWAGLCLFSLIILLLLLLLARRIGRSPRAAWTAGGLLLAVHAMSQVFLLHPLYPTDPVAPYRVPPPALAWLPAGMTAVNPDFEHLFGMPVLAAGKFPSDALLWLERRAFYELFPFVGPMWDRRFEINESPEGLDSYYIRLVQGALPTATDEQRLRLLAAWGVDRVIMERPLRPTSHSRLLAEFPSFGQAVHVYEVTGRAPQAFLARRVWLAADMTTAYNLMKTDAFNPQTDVMMPGKGGARPSAGGTVRILSKGPESLDLDLNVGAGGSVLLVQRTNLIYRATVDGKRAPLLVANLVRNGLVVPAGRHRVRLWVDRTNFHLSVAAALLGLAALPGLVVWGGRRRRPPDRFDPQPQPPLPAANIPALS